MLPLNEICKLNFLVFSQQFHLIYSSCGMQKNLHCCSEGAGDVDPGVVADLSWAGYRLLRRGILMLYRDNLMIVHQVY